MINSNPFSYSKNKVINWNFRIIKICSILLIAGDVKNGFRDFFEIIKKIQITEKTLQIKKN